MAGLMRRLRERDLDVRIKLLIVIESGSLTFLTGDGGLLLLAALSSFGIVAWFGQVKTALRFLAAFLMFFAIRHVSSSFLEGRVIGMVLGMLSFLMLRMLPVLMLGSWLVRTTKINDLIASLEKMKLPASVIIPLAVTLRFMPTIKAEFRYIKNTMKMRGISISLSAVVKRPLLTTEYAMVPLLMRSIKVADELSASALTRGLGSHKNRTSYRNVRLNKYDACWALGFTVFTAGATIIWKFTIF